MQKMPEQIFCQLIGNEQVFEFAEGINSLFAPAGTPSRL
jgi:hypothetical protein